MSASQSCLPELHANFLQGTDEGSKPAGFSLPQGTGESGSSSSDMSYFSGGNGYLAVSCSPTEPVPLVDADFSLSVVPCTDRDVAEFACEVSNIADSYTPCTTSPLNEPRNDSYFTESSHYSESFRLGPQQDYTYMANPGSRNGFSGEQDFHFSASLHNVRHKVKKKQEVKGFSLPDSLVRSFDASEMDKIANSIVRVNKYGSSAMTNKAPKSGSFPFKNANPRVLPSIGAFTVQCGKCFKWRLIPSKEQYEQIRQNISEKPFFCTSWRPGASCDDPAELSEASKLLWAIDKPNIPAPPDGWQRLLVIRGEGCSKFADTYYVSPAGKKLRSMPEVERYLSEHPELVDRGVSLSQFSFATPKSLDKNYCRKRSSVMRGSIGFPTNNTGVSQPQDEQALLRFTENAPLAVEPLRAWDSNQQALMISHHPLQETSEANF
ncbi:hypothetical protein L7F22_010650 [Adiantum nelumboides]|nr:hypothetical protein [Adiantum nelumboides]